MFRLHKEGNQTILITSLVLLAVNLLTFNFLPEGSSWVWIGLAGSIVIYLLVLQFFRNPIREVIEVNDDLIYAPADGKVVVIEKTTEKEYFKDDRIQISIFMSPMNVHVNRNPIGGIVKYLKYHPGKYLVAWHPKSSEENERTTVVIENNQNEVLFRQIAGAMAKRIVYYLEEGQNVLQGGEMGFIKFGSRVDVFLPTNAEIKVDINQKVKGNQTVLAQFPK